MGFFKRLRNISVYHVVLFILVGSLFWYFHQSSVRPSPIKLHAVDKDVLDWAKSNKLSPVVASVLAKEGYNSLDAISFITADDIVDINAKPAFKGVVIPRGQQRLLIRAAQQLAAKGVEELPGPLQQAQSGTGPPDSPGGVDLPSAMPPSDGSKDPDGLMQEPQSGAAVPESAPAAPTGAQSQASIAGSSQQPAFKPAPLRTNAFKYLEKPIVRTGETKFLDTHVNYTYLDWKRPEDSDLPGVQEIARHSLKTMRQTMNSTKQVYLSDGMPAQCATKNFGDLSDLPKASVHITFHDHENLLNVAHTLHSIFLNSPHELVEEIILIDDKSVKEELKELLQNYVDAVFGHLATTIRVVRSDTKLGAIRTRLLAARLAKADVLVVMDSHMEFRPFWLQSLLYEIKLNRKTLATSCLDWIRPDKDIPGNWIYEHGGSNYRGVFDWDMSFGYYTRYIPAGRDPTEPYLVPFQLGGALAIDREFFFEVGAFDEGMGAWGGENIDLSLKVYLCGGKVIQVPCSHAAHVEIPGQRDYRAAAGWDDSLKRNNKRIAKTFFGPYEKYIYIFNKGLRDLDPGDMSARLASFQKCSGNFSWYLENFYPEMGDPEIDALAYGQVKNMKSQECIDRATVDAGKVNACHQLGSPQALIWSGQGYLRTGMATMFVEENNSKMVGHLATWLLDPTYETTRFIHWKDGLLIVAKTLKCLEVSNSSTLIVDADCDPTNQGQLWSFDTYTDNYQAFLLGEYKEKSSLVPPEAGQRFYEKAVAMLQKFKVLHVPTSQTYNP